jgi:hypothetical protein
VNSESPPTDGKTQQNQGLFSADSVVHGSDVQTGDEQVNEGAEKRKAYGGCPNPRCRYNCSNPDLLYCPACGADLGRFRLRADDHDAASIAPKSRSLGQKAAGEADDDGEVEV